MEGQTLDLNGPVYFVHHAGQGPPMVLVHGLGGSHLNWAAVAPFLAVKRPVFALDLPGFGRTPLAGRSTRVDDNARLIARFLASIADEPATLVGNSMGGMLSIRVGARWPDRVRALVLVNSAHPPSLRVRPDLEIAAIFSLYMIPVVGGSVARARASRMSAEALVRFTLRLCCAEPEKVDPALVAAHIRLEEERRAMGWSHSAFNAAARSLMYALAIPRRLAKLSDAVRAPTLVVHGARDRLVPLGAARVAARRHSWDIRVIEDVGHVPQLEAPEEFVRIVDEWLAGREN
jgi:pimeloyl-ACP methyl ester carboxylesterase